MIQDRTVTRIGSHVPVSVDLRIVATMKSDPQDEVAAGRLRPDLLYRLNVVTLRLPSLDERREDVALLFLQFVSEASTRLGREDAGVPPAVLNDIVRRAWPGNVREVRNAAERYVLGLGFAAPDDAREEPTTRRLADRVADYERSLIAGALATSGGSLKAVYESLGVSRKTLYEKMQKFGLDKRDFGEDDAPTSRREGRRARAAGVGTRRWVGFHPPGGAMGRFPPIASECRNPSFNKPRFAVASVRQPALSSPQPHRVGRREAVRQAVWEDTHDATASLISPRPRHHRPGPPARPKRRSATDPDRHRARNAT